jgi:hypothetical protein
MEREKAHTVARTAHAVLERCARWLPATVRTRLDNRLFYAIFQVSRVTNDHYPSRD